MMKTIRSGAAFCVLSLALLLLVARDDVKVVLADPPPEPTCRVFCFRITDIRADADIADRFHFEFEVLNWSDAFAGGVSLFNTIFSSDEIAFVDPPALGGVDEDGTPLDPPGNGVAEIPGNLDRPNTWNMARTTPVSMEWVLGDAIPYVDLISAGSNCQACIRPPSFLQRGGPPFQGFDTLGNVIPLEWIDNGNNVQDGFVMTIDGFGLGRVAHINWFLTGAGGAQTPSTDSCSTGGRTNLGLAVPIGTGINPASGNAYGFGLVSLVRFDINLPAPFFQGQTGFLAGGAEFFNDVNVVDLNNGLVTQPQMARNLKKSSNNNNRKLQNANQANFAMEFTPATTCQAPLTVNGGSPANCVLINPFATGDPHFMTWGGEKYDFHGECDLVLIDHPQFRDGLGLTVHVRTKIVTDGVGGDRWSYIARVAIRIGNDVLEILGDTNEHWLNGKNDFELPGIMGGNSDGAASFKVTYGKRGPKSHFYTIDLNEAGTEKIWIKCFHEYVYVDVDNSEHGSFAGSEGLFGDFVTGHKIARNGTTIIKDPYEFGQEWQVRPGADPTLFRFAEEPVYPTQCKLPSKADLRFVPKRKDVKAARQQRRRLGGAITDKMAKLACASVKQFMMDECVFDVMATGDLTMAQAYDEF